jgi:hypothetical protein
VIHLQEPSLVELVDVAGGHHGIVTGVQRPSSVRDTFSIDPGLLSARYFEGFRKHICNREAFARLRRSQILYPVAAR